MKAYGLEIPETTNGVVNLTAPSGTSFPPLENAGEFFFRTDLNKLFVHGTHVGSPTEWMNLTNPELLLDELLDVSLGSPILDGYFLAYDEETNTWQPSPAGANNTQRTDFEYTATADQTTFSGSDDNGNVLDYTPGQIFVFLNGILLQDVVDYTASNGTSIILSNGVNEDDLLVVASFMVVDLIGTSLRTFVYTATDSQTTFTGVDDNSNTLAYTVDAIMVFQNGGQLLPSQYTADNGTSVILDSGASEDDSITIIAVGEIGQSISYGTNLSATTTDDTETELSASGPSYFTISENTTYLVDINIVARKTSGGSPAIEHAAWNIKATIENTSGSTTLVGNTLETEITNLPEWGISVTADDANDRLAVKVTGIPSATIKWSANITHVSTN